jgi:hypothetical protein
MTPSQKVLAIVVLACLGLALPSPASADIIFQDNFNAENGGVGQLNYNSFANWNVNFGTVDLIGNGFFDFLPGNGLYVDLDGSTLDPGVLSTKQSFDPGSYRLEFDLFGSRRGDTNQVTVALDGWFETFTLNSDDSLHVVREFDTTFTSPLAFANSPLIGQGDNVGAILDNVTLTQIPEPATLVLLGVGAAGLYVFGRRARARTA